MGVMHYGLKISYPSVFKLAFVLSAVFHGFYGLWGIAEEHIRQSALLKAVRAFILASAFLLASAGIYRVV
jgi:succinate dehydrogenase hydrophobic anchor subunit